MLFETGRLVLTPGADEAFTSDELIHSLYRFLKNDWGESDSDLAVRYGGPIVGTYRVRGMTLLIVTKADRSATTIRLGDDA